MRQAILAAAVTMGVSSVASAEQWPLWANVASWRIEYSPDTCVTIEPYKSGTSLGFGLGKNLLFSISFHRQDWKIPTGVYQVGLYVDGLHLGTYNADGEGGNVLMLFELQVDFVNKLRFGRTMHAVIGNQRYGFNLTGTRDMLPELVRCGYALKGTSNPFAGTQNRANPFAGSQDGVFRGDPVLPPR